MTFYYFILLFAVIGVSAVLNFNRARAYRVESGVSTVSHPVQFALFPAFTVLASAILGGILLAGAEINNFSLPVFILFLAAGAAFGLKTPFAVRNIRKVNEKIILACAFIAAAVALLTTIGIILSLIGETLYFFTLYSPYDFFFGTEWSPQIALREDQVGASGAFGVIPILTGTLLITFIALCVAFPVGLAAAVWLSEYAGEKRNIGKPAVEILAGVPTVVYGFFAITTVAPFIKDIGECLGLSVSSESALAAGLTMGVMIIPYVCSLSDDALRSVPQTLRDGSLALGATQTETILKTLIPAAFPGIISAFILSFSRAIGETMIVLMAAGLSANLTANPLAAVTTFTVQIGSLLTGDQEFDSVKTLSAFALGFVLFMTTLILNIISVRMIQKYRNKYD